MRIERKNKMLFFIGNVVTFFVISFLLVFIARAGYLTPNLNPPNNDIAEPIRIDGDGQIKEASLILNLQGPPNTSVFKDGLTVYESPVGSSRGKVGIGADASGPNTNPTERLDILGNFQISGINNDPNIRGIIKPLDPSNTTGVPGSLGQDGQVLTMISSAAMDWADALDKYAWMSIQRIDTYNITTNQCDIFFPACPPTWTEHLVVPSNPPSCNITPASAVKWEYGNQVRICFKNF